MRSILLLAICSVCFSAEVNKPAPISPRDSVVVGKVEAAPPAMTVTDADLQNLSACARMVLKDLTPEQMQAVAIAIKHAEADLAAMRKAAAAMPPPPAEAKKP